MINGPAVGSGMDMALHCDIRIGCEQTRFIGYQQLGQIMENGGCYYLPKMVAWAGPWSSPTSDTLMPSAPTSGDIKPLGER